MGQVDCNTAVNGGKGEVGIDRSSSGTMGAGGSNQGSMEQTSNNRIRCDFSGEPAAGTPGGSGTVQVQNRGVPVEEFGSCVGLIFDHCRKLFEAGLIRSEFSNCSEQDFFDAIILRQASADNCMMIQPTDLTYPAPGCPAPTPPGGGGGGGGG